MGVNPAISKGNEQVNQYYTKPNVYKRQILQPSLKIRVKFPTENIKGNSIAYTGSNHKKRVLKLFARDER